MIRITVVALVALIILVRCNYLQSLNQTAEDTIPEKAVLTIDEVSQNRENLVGGTISVEGTVSLLGPGCTEAICDTPCCNTCWGHLYFFSEIDGFWVEFTADHGPMGCGGNDCELTCEPFEPGDNVIVTGRLENCQWFHCYLAVDDFEYCDKG